MEKDKKNGLANLTKKAAAIFGAAIVALTGIQANAPDQTQYDNFESNTIQVRKISKAKPMPVLKLNMKNSQNSVMVANHGSHRSHSSHSSHYSHRSGMVG